MGPTHLNSTKWTGFNTVGGGLTFFLILGTFVYLGFKSRNRFRERLRDWHETMKVKETVEKDEKEEAINTDMEHPEGKQEDNEQ